MQRKQGQSILIIGGAGAMGRLTVKDLASDPQVKRLTVADINISAAEHLISGMDSPAKLDAVRLDALNRQQVLNAMQGYDLIVSSIGPFYVFEELLVEAAIQSGVDYISICDEWDVMQKVQERFGKPAKDAGVKIVCGMGASPGLTNMLAKYLSNQLDEVSSIEISVYLPLDSGAGPAAIKHGVYIMTEDMAVWREGSLQMIKPCSESVRKDFPDNRSVRLWNMGHSEPLTLSANIKGVRNVNFYMGFGTGDILLTGPARLGWYNNPVINKMLTDAFIRIEKLFPGDSGKPGWIRVDAEGKTESGITKLLAVGTANMQDSTALALSAGVQMMVRGHLIHQDGGIFAPEAVFPADLSLQMFKSKGLTAYADLAMTKAY